MYKQRIRLSKQMKKLIKIVLKQYPNKSDRIIKRALEINQNICEDNPNQPRKIAMHTRNRIYPTISIYKSIIEITGNKESAYRTIEDCFSHDSKKVNKILRILCKIPFGFKFGPEIMHIVICIQNYFGEEQKLLQEEMSVAILYWKFVAVPK